MKYVYIGDGSAWPLTISLDPDQNDIEWRLRYAPESITLNDLLVCAAIINAYNSMMLATSVKQVPTILKKYRRIALEELIDDTNE